MRRSVKADATITCSAPHLAKETSDALFVDGRQKGKLWLEVFSVIFKGLHCPTLRLM
jgi:hypothetical protein